ncbi:hypothetical protein LJR231_003474 [Phyllobacterium sp. LjRoot231]|uniref:hypothetical protein n=1 Tax=Phyllobacterium sp. LjRoot231 TaxID=3342289 RepID=UPI003ECFA399
MPVEDLEITTTIEKDIVELSIYESMVLIWSSDGDGSTNIRFTPTEARMMAGWLARAASSIENG